MQKIKAQISAFTLLEVLVALIVIAVGLTAAIISSIEITRNSAHLQDKTYAHWVAENVINQRQIQSLASQPKPDQGTAEMAGQPWQWQIQTKPSRLDKVQEITVTVSQNQHVLAELISYEIATEASQ